MTVQKIVVALTGATGVGYGIRLLEALRDCGGVETHLIVSDFAEKIIRLETDREIAEVKALAHYCYDLRNMLAPVASGSFFVSGMVVIPCSMNSLAAIAHGLANNLIIRAADVTLKERRKLILVPRETPLSLLHLENMATLAKAGAYILPPMPAFYNHPKTIEDIVDHLVGRVMDQLGLAQNLTKPWKGAHLD